MKKLLFISYYDSSFVRNDIEILERNYHVSVPNLRQSRRKFINYLLMTFTIFWGALRSDLIFCWFADFAAFIAVKAGRILRKKVFVVVGGYEVSNLPGYGGLNDVKRIQRLRYTLQNANGVITISDFSKAEIEALDLQISTHKISIGVEPLAEIFHKKKMIITSGSATKELYQIKGLDVFARATANLVGIEIKLIGPYDEEIKQHLLEINPHLEFTGKLPHSQFLELLKSAKVYCQLSQRESFGLAILEAMNYGCIPVVARAGAMPEIVGKVGFICTYGDAKKAEKAIASALRSNDEMAVRKRAAVSFSRREREEKLIRLLGRER